MEISANRVTLDKPTTEINLYTPKRGVHIEKVKQDSLGRVYITIKEVNLSGT